MWGNHKVPPGDSGIVAIVSVNKDQAVERIETIESILKACKIPYKRTGDTVELTGRGTKFKVFAASTMAAVGFTAICIIADEIALWRNDKTGANPAETILSFLRPTMATQPNAKMFLSSSPFSTLDAHHKAFELGDTASQLVRYAPTWVANPTITEAQSHELEPDPLEWARQFKAVPMSAGSLCFFDPVAIERAIDTSLILPLSPLAGDIVTAGGDFGFRSDSSALAVAYRRGNTYYTAELLELRPQQDEPLRPSLVVKTFADVLKTHGCAYLTADGHYRQSISEHLEAEDLHFTIAPEGAKGNQEVYVRFRRLLLDGQIKLPKNERLLDQLKLVTSQPTSGGAISIKQPRTNGGHGDLVSALVLACYQRAGSEIAGVTEKFGTPEYWRKWNSPEQVNAREELQILKEEEEATQDKPWWDQ
jgi:phage terminase large subunit-like protein